MEDKRNQDAGPPQPALEQTRDESSNLVTGVIERPNREPDATLSGQDSTLEVSGLPDMPVPKLDALTDQIAREQVFEALFDASSESVALGRYQVLGTLGRGGMGTVLQAFDPTLDRRVAIKVLHKELDTLHTARLRREAQAMAKLSHPNVVQVYEVGEVDGQTFVAMELVKGQTLKEWMRRVPRPHWRECVEVYLQVGAGLAAAHERGLVHRDFKPGNAMIDRKQRVRVLDFGLARQVEGVEVDETTAVRPGRTDEMDPVPLEVSLTNTGTVLGTPAYMPPEQMHGVEADARSDQFSFCVALYEAIYGHRPYEGSTMAGLMLSMNHGRLRSPPREVKIPSKLRKVLLRGLARFPEDRWPTMDALLTELRHLATPRRGPWVAIGVTGGLTILGAVAWQQATRSSRCDDASEQLEGIWDDEQQRAVEQAIMSSGRPHASDSSDRVAQGFHEYADRWTGKFVDVCEAKATADEQALEGLLAQTRCLDERKTALHAAVKALREADEAMAGRAIDVVLGLPRIERCDDIEALLAKVPPPEDPQVAAAVEQLREQLARLEVMREAGKYVRGLEEIGSLVHEAEALEYAPLVAEAMRLRGQLYKENGQYPEAEQDLKQAYWIALEHGHDEVVLDVATNLAFVVGYLQARYTDGLEWARTSMSMAKHSGDDTKLANSLDRLATILDHQGHYKASNRHYRRALELLRSTVGTGHPLVARSMNNLGEMLIRWGKYEDAEHELRNALEIAEAAFGANHPALAHKGTNLGNVLLRQGRYNEAEHELQRALEIRERGLGADHPLVAVTVSALGLVRYSQGKYDEAEKHHRHALRIQEQTFEPDHPDVANSLNNLGNALSAQGKFEEAKGYFERARQSFEQALGAGQANVASSVHNLGVLLYGQKKYEDAERELRRALEISERALGTKHPDVAKSIHHLGRVLHAQGRYEDAEHELRRALQMREHVLGKDHPEVAKSLTSLGWTLFRRGKYEAAEYHCRQALHIQERILSKDHPDLAQSANFLGIMLQFQGRYEEAERYYRQALETRERALGKEHPNLANSFRSLGIVSDNLGKYEDAKRYHEQALQTDKKSYGSDHPNVGKDLGNLANVFLNQEDYETAKKYHEQALQIFERSLDPGHPHVAMTLNNLGDVYTQQKEYTKAQRHYERALRTWEKALGTDHPNLAYSLEGLAQIALAQRAFKLARKHAERAVLICEAGKVAPERLASARFALARSLWPDPTQRSRALELAEQARRAFAEHGLGSKDSLAETDAWLAAHRPQ